MLITLSRDRYLHVPTGTVIRLDRPQGTVEFYQLTRIWGHDATIAIDALDELLRRQDTETASLRFGVPREDCGTSPVTGQHSAREPGTSLTADDMRGYEPDPRD